MRRTKLERESTVLFNDAESDALLWTASPIQVRRWTKIGLTVTPRGGGWQAIVPKRCVRIRSPFINRVPSDKQTAALLGHRKAVADAKSTAKQVAAAKSADAPSSQVADQNDNN
jgi:hypothetical protein